MKKIILLTISCLFALAINAQVSKIVNVKIAGSLSVLISLNERTTVTNLTLTGTIDARDFKFMRDYMSVLSVLDMSAVSIAEYYGMISEISGLETFPANIIPWHAFCTLDGPSDNYVLSSVLLPPNIVEIGSDAFSNCHALKNIMIPATVSYIGSAAFCKCDGFKSIIVNSSIPVPLSLSKYVFAAVDTNNCILYVPNGSKSAYRSANQWNAFKNIVEFNPLVVDVVPFDKCTVFPNPATTSFSIDINKQSIIEIYSNDGTLVLKKEVEANEYISISTLLSGLYLVRIIVDDRIIIKQLLKQ